MGKNMMDIVVMPVILPNIVKEIVELKIPVLLFSPDFINKYFYECKYIGKVDDINNYLINSLKNQRELKHLVQCYPWYHNIDVVLVV